MPRLLPALAVAAAVAVFAGGLAAGPQSAGAAQAATTGRSPAAGTQFYVKAPMAAAEKQLAQLQAVGQASDASGLAAMLATPQAVWLTGGTESQVYNTVRTTVAAAQAAGSVPVFVAYNIPGRDCGHYSAGGATDGTAYAGWIGALSSGLGSAHAIVLLEPDSLGNLPSSCGTSYTGPSDSARLYMLKAAVARLEKQPGAAVYLDGTNSNWLKVGIAAQRLAQAGVAAAQGLFLNVSNYLPTAQQAAYGRWVSDCLAYGSLPAHAGAYADCPSQYYPANMADPSTWPTVDAWYAARLGTTTPTAHVVIDTSRNGGAAEDWDAYASAPYDQSAAVTTTLRSGAWCNAPHAGLGATPQAQPGPALVDAYLWVKTPGSSDGRCDAAGGVRAWDYTAYSASGWPTTDAARSTFDPLWGVQDPGAGTWFPQAALGLVRNRAVS